MSDSFFRYIPVSPTYVPSEAAQAAAARLCRRELGAVESSLATLPSPELIDCGGNFERISCPECDSEISIAWWHEAMTRASASRFADLGVVTPCCTRRSTLNDLRYEWPMGIARFVLEVVDPPDEAAAAKLQPELGTPLRVVRAHS